LTGHRPAFVWRMQMGGSPMEASVTWEVSGQVETFGSSQITRARSIGEPPGAGGGGGGGGGGALTVMLAVAGADVSVASDAV
jgi:hypothetical protein